MTEIDDKLLADVYTIAQTYGKSVVFTIRDAQSYNPATGKVSTGGATAITLNVTPPAQFELRYVDGDMIRERDVKVTVPAKNLTFTPDLGHNVTIDSEVFDVVTVNPLYSGANICAYEVQLRQ